jgi:hypothetical protein
MTQNPMDFVCGGGMPPPYSNYCNRTINTNLLGLSGLEIFDIIRKKRGVRVCIPGFMWRSPIFAICTAPFVMATAVSLGK